MIVSRHFVSVFCFEQRQERLQRLGAVADEIDFHRIPQAQIFALDVDLHAARVPGLRQELAVGKSRADHQQRVAVLHQIP